ncbi:MAG: hypothetical protein ACUVXA_16565 [Candidatus Jordarchaeum sp.]|uniref:hypothetical protein n=1 Tax=Candidatus Jordarchaeum sp. TaxID=2823881 RepID=UPI0040497C22
METASALVFTEDIDKNYKRIKQLPKFSAEELERRRKIYLNRKREEMGRHLSFYCPRCRENVTSLLDSLILQSALRGKMTPEEACENFKLSHYRHIHTDYESELFSVEEKVQDYYSEELCPKYDYGRCQVMLEAFQKSIKYTKQKAKIKARCNKKAKRLIREDFSQKMDEEQEEHSGRIKNFQSP